MTTTQPPAPIFVVHKHDASRLHYDLRLEVGGVLVSWSVPKGPSTDPRVKRLAIRTPDHPLEYADFEGVIPEGEYGAGAVIIWDRGTYRNLTRRDAREVPVPQALAEGHVSVWLEGHKLVGGYALTRIDRGGREMWLVVKMADEAADPARDPVVTRPDSVVSGRTVEEVRRPHHLGVTPSRGTTMTGRLACWASCWLTLPSNSSSNPPVPRRPTTMRPALCASAVSMSTAAGLPSTTRA